MPCAPVAGGGAAESACREEKARIENSTKPATGRKITAGPYHTRTLLQLAEVFPDRRDKRQLDRPPADGAPNEVEASGRAEPSRGTAPTLRAAVCVESKPDALFAPADREVERGTPLGSGYLAEAGARTHNSRTISKLAAWP